MPGLPRRAGLAIGTRDARAAVRAGACGGRTGSQAPMSRKRDLLSGPRRARCRRWCDDADVIDDADTAQARELLQSLHTHVDEISKKVESAEIRTRRVQGHAAVVARRRVASLRHELYEAHRLIDGLHRRFPDARPRRIAGPRTECSR